MDGINRRSAMKLAATTGISSSLLATLGSEEVAAATSPEEVYPESETAHLTGSTSDPAVSQGTTIGWHRSYIPDPDNVPTEDIDYWLHEFSITSTSTGWLRNSYDGSMERNAATISGIHWELDMSGTFSTQSDHGDFTHFPMSDEKYAGYYPHPDNSNENYWQGLEILFDAAISVISAGAGAALIADDLISLMVEDASQGLTELSKGWTFDNNPDGYHEQMHSTHRIQMEVPFDVDDSDEVEITVWTGGQVGVEVSYTLAFTENGDDPPAQTSSVSPSTLDPDKMTPEQKDKYGVKKASGSSTNAELSVNKEGTESSSAESVAWEATNLPLQVKSTSRVIKPD
ncbi:hypothetical protein J2753_002582 [Halolamina salifodinae]|uniref:Uncharacterized protein n=2 Tax=Halolamina salifodinae TaxID=1202767 RepID=A0A8T4H061_9EURY|nr:hypothetical protein [Halolamina salifodinae]